MKKIAIVAALLATMSVAQADVGIFGVMDAGYSSIKAPGAATATTSFASGGMTTSHIGFRGNEDLGNGTKAFFELSSFINDGNGATMGGNPVNTFTRSSYVGLSDNQYGTITMGRQSTPSFLPNILFNAYGDSGTYGPLWHATYFGKTGNPMTQLYNDTAWDNTISYTTPDLAGAKVTVINAKGTTSQNNGANVLYFKGDLGLMAFYESTTFYGSGSFQTNAFTNGGSADKAGVGASYDFHVAKVFLTYQKADDDTTNQHGTTWQTSALIPAGRGNIMVEYATTENSGVNTKTYTEYAVGYDYKMSKKVDVYATVGRTNVTGLSDGETVGVGMRVRF